MPSIGYDVVVAILFNYLNRFQKLNLVFILALVYAAFQGVFTHRAEHRDQVLRGIIVQLPLGCGGS
jgi:hypothetical protein